MVTFPEGSETDAVKNTSGCYSRETPVIFSQNSETSVIQKTFTPDRGYVRLETDHCPAAALERLHHSSSQTRLRGFHIHHHLDSLATSAEKHMIPAQTPQLPVWACERTLGAERRSCEWRDIRPYWKLY